MCVGAMKCKHLHYFAFVSGYIVVLSEGGRWQVCMYRRECVFLCVLERSRGTWLMLWTRLRDSVSVALLPLPRQPQTHAGTHTTSFSLSFYPFFPPYLILLLLSQIIHDFFFISQILTQLQGYCSCVAVCIAIYLLYTQ